MLRDGAAATAPTPSPGSSTSCKTEGLDASVTYGQYLSTVTRGYGPNEGFLSDGSDRDNSNWDASGETGFNRIGAPEDIKHTDGQTYNLNLGYGFNVNEGTIYVSGSLRHRDFVNRAGLDPRTQYYDGYDFSAFGAQYTEDTFPRLNHRYGNGEFDDLTLFVNGSIPVGESGTQLYSFAGLSAREGLSGCFYRRSLDNRSNYWINAGDDASWMNGGVPVRDGPNEGRSTAAGAQCLPGFQPRSEQDETRTNFGFYVDVENNITSAFLVNLAARFENYSDFGSTVTGKVAARYEFVPGLALRGAVSTGYRAPSLAQAWFTSIATNFIDAAVAEFLGKQGINANGGRYFTNAMDTRTQGVDIIGRYGTRLGPGTVRFTAALNFTDTKVTNLDLDTDGDGEADAIASPAQLAALNEASLVGRSRIGDYQDAQPNDKFNFQVNYDVDAWRFLIRANRYGEVTSLSASDPLRDETFGAKWLTDVEVAYQVLNKVSLAVGSNNLFDVYPDKQFKRNSFNGIFPYDGFSPFGFFGRYIYSRVNVKLGS